MFDMNRCLSFLEAKVFTNSLPSDLRVNLTVFCVAFFITVVSNLSNRSKDSRRISKKQETNENISKFFFMPRLLGQNQRQWRQWKQNSSWQRSSEYYSAMASLGHSLRFSGSNESCESIAKLTKPCKNNSTAATQSGSATAFTASLARHSIVPNAAHGGADWQLLSFTLNCGLSAVLFAHLRHRP